MITERVQRPTARISVTVTDFHEIGREGGCTRADIELTDTGNGTVSQSGVNAVIEVDADVYLEFSVYPGKGDRYTYIPVGIGFKGRAGASKSKQAATSHCEGNDGGDPLGSAAFPMRSVVAKGNTAQLTLHDANPEERLFEFGLFIQRSDGALSVVDPGVKNNGVLR